MSGKWTKKTCVCGRVGEEGRGIKGRCIEGRGIEGRGRVWRDCHKKNILQLKIHKNSTTIVIHPLRRRGPVVLHTLCPPCWTSRHTLSSSQEYLAPAKNKRRRGKRGGGSEEGGGGGEGYEEKAWSPLQCQKQKHQLCSIPCKTS